MLCSTTCLLTTNSFPGWASMAAACNLLSHPVMENVLRYLCVLPLGFLCLWNSSAARADDAPAGALLPWQQPAAKKEQTFALHQPSSHFFPLTSQHARFALAPRASHGPAASAPANRLAAMPQTTLLSSPDLPPPEAADLPVVPMTPQQAQQILSLFDGSD